MIARNARHLLAACLVPVAGLAAGLAYDSTPEPPYSLARGVERLMAGADATSVGAAAILVALVLTLLGQLNWRVGTATLLCGLLLCGLDEMTPSPAPAPVRIAAR